ncbi:hypothetical protein [Pseudomonas sp. FW306-2-2C-D06B]|uniref:Methyl-accepting chemotaxis protein n=2 Tax=Pseudomonas TaxID=286 RepID=A0A109KX46_PSEFL|nr:hypothetical protein [Pseudomonas sp. FW306-2-2C-D06B]KWV77061.1 hypothetical protein PFL603g_02443 [Pseudomonas fluorescens]
MLSRKLSEQLGELFEELVNALRLVGDGVICISNMNAQIASATEEQSTVTPEVNGSVASIRHLTESFAGSLQTSALEITALGQSKKQQQALLDGFQR